MPHRREAPRRRTHSRNRFQNHGLLRVTATSDRHRIPTMSARQPPRALSFLSFPLTPSQYDANWNLPVVTRRHKSISNCAPELRSLFCGVCQRPQSCPIPLGQCTVLLNSKSAKPTESFRGVTRACPLWRALSLAVCCRSRPVRQ